MAFYVELPADEYGNRAYTNRFPCVVEAELSGNDLVFKAPPEIVDSWPSVKFNGYGAWLECEGPARPITNEERDQIIINVTEK
jgi:hypothetical protein